jgi:hypothetical protein
MADNVQLNVPTTSGATIATDDIGGVQHQKVKVEFGGDGVATEVSAADPLPVVQTGTPVLPTGAATAANQQTDALTDLQLRATPVPISGTVSTGLSQPLTDTQLRLTPVPVSLSSTPLPSGSATAAKQDEQTALLTTLNSLIETNNYIMNFLSQLTSAMNSGAPALRTIPIASVSTAVTGSVTATVASTVVSSVTNFGTGIPATEMAHDINNYTAIVANINNVTA